MRELMLTTVGDLLRWADHMVSAWPELQVPSKLTNGGRTPYGLGARLERLHYQRVP